MRLTRLGCRLRPDDVVEAGERQQVAELGCVDHELRPQPAELQAHEVEHGDRLDPATGRAHADRLAAPQDPHGTRLDERREQGVDRAHGHRRLEREAR